MAGIQTGILGLVEAARRLGLPLPREVARPDSAPAHLLRTGPAGTSPEPGSSTKRAASSGDKSEAASPVEEYRRLRRRLTNRESAQRVRQKCRDEFVKAQEESRALAAAFQELQQSHAAASKQVSQLQCEADHWRRQAQHLAVEAQQLRHCLVLTQMQLEGGKEQDTASALCKVDCTAAPVSAAPEPCWPSLAHSCSGLILSSQNSSLPPAGPPRPPSCSGLLAPAGPVPDCGDWLDAILPEAEDDFLA